jgi:hypothetical protein
MHMDERLRKSPLVQAVFGVQEPGGFQRLAKMISEVAKAGRAEEAHVLSDNFIGAACRVGRHLGTAERLARKLVKQQPDRHHFRYLAQVLELRGKKREAAIARRKAEVAPDEHMTPEIVQAIREAEEALDQK